MPHSWILLVFLPSLLLPLLHLLEARPVSQVPLTNLPVNDCKPVKFNRLVIHGDSFSDNGNVYELSNHTWPRDEFYYKGRFSNGPVWSDHVAEALDVVLENYAHGSATTDSRIVQGKTGINADLPVPGFIQQIQLFHDTNIQQQIDLADTLFAISFQGNDFWFDPTIDTQVVLGSIERGIRQLIGLGARHFLVLKNSDFGLIPAFGGNSTMAKERSQVSAKLLREYKGMSERLAQEFGQTFVECDEEGSSESDSNNSNNKTKVNIVFYDLLEFLKTLRDPGTLARLHISNTTHGCVSPDYQTGCNDPGEYFFYDSFHPSAKVHRAIGEAVLAFLSEK